MDARAALAALGVTERARIRLNLFQEAFHCNTIRLAQSLEQLVLKSVPFTDEHIDYLPAPIRKTHQRKAVIVRIHPSSHYSLGLQPHDLACERPAVDLQATLQIGLAHLIHRTKLDQQLPARQTDAGVPRQPISSPIGLLKSSSCTSMGNCPVEPVLAQLFRLHDMAFDK